MSYKVTAEVISERLGIRVSEVYRYAREGGIDSAKEYDINTCTMSMVYDYKQLVEYRKIKSRKTKKNKPNIIVNNHTDVGYQNLIQDAIDKGYSIKYCDNAKTFVFYDDNKRIELKEIIETIYR